MIGIFWANLGKYELGFVLINFTFASTKFIKVTNEDINGDFVKSVATLFTTDKCI